MNILFKRQLSILAFSLLIISGCRKLVQSEFPDFDPVPAINSILISGRPLQVHVSLAGKLDTTELDWVDNAEVLLYIDGQFEEILETSGGGIYTSIAVIEPLRNYECRVNIPGFREMVCSHKLPLPIPLTDIEQIEKAGKDEEGMTYPAIKFTFQNNPHEKQYYQAVIRFFQGEYESIGQLIDITDMVLLNEGLPLAIFSNELIKDYVYTMTINYTTGSAGSRDGGAMQTNLYPLILELRSVSYDYYQYVKQLYLYEKGRYPYNVAGGTVTTSSLYSNIQGGYGIFAGYSSVVSDTIYPSQHVKK